MDTKIIILALFSIFISIGTAHGYGMASNYLENKTMILLPGETREYTVELQNADDTVIAFVFELESDIAEIAQKKDKYYVGGNNTVIPIIIKVRMPKDAMPGEEYTVNYSAYPISEGTQQINLNFKFKDSFIVVSAIAEEKEDTMLFVLLLPILLVFSFVILIIFKKSNLLFNKRL